MEAHRSSLSTSAAIARGRSFHQPSGRLPITFMPSTIHRARPPSAATHLEPSSALARLLQLRLELAVLGRGDLLLERAQRIDDFQVRKPQQPVQPVLFLGVGLTVPALDVADQVVTE